MPYKVFARDECTPLSHMVFYSMAGLSDKASKLIGVKPAPALQEIKDLYVRWCLEEKNTLKIEKAILKKIANPRFNKLVVEKSKSSIAEHKRWAEKVKQRNYSSYSLKKLKKELVDYMDVWIEAAIWGHIVNFTDFHFGLMSKKIIDLLTSRLKKEKSSWSVFEAFTTLTTPTKTSLIFQEEIDLLRILEKMQARQNHQITPSQKQAIRKHANKYDWLQYHYIGPTILPEKYFRQKLVNLLNRKVDAKKKIAEIQNNRRKLVKKQQRIYREIKFSSEEKYWINLAQTFGFLKVIRKEVVFMASRALHNILREIAKKWHLSFRQLQYLSLPELLEALAGRPLPPVKLLNERIKYCVLYYPKNQPKVYVGKKAKQLAGKIVELKLKKGAKQLTGSPSYPGKVRGKVVRIMKAVDMKKMKKGNILVAPATNPNVMPAIIKAAAIVTNEGGVTCHAAIVSRELKIPCVIGTHIATQFLKDGDKVEVNANKGIVKKI